MAFAIWDSAAHLRPSACFHSTSGIVGDWESGSSLQDNDRIEWMSPLVCVAFVRVSMHAMAWASCALADVNSPPSMSAVSWASSAHDVNSPPSMSAMQMWRSVPELLAVNSSLRCLAAQADAPSADVSSSLRCLLHCMRLLELDVCTARHRGWGEKMP